jgi:hypothetical protein
MQVSKRDEILAAAQALFAEYGYAGTTMRMIAERAGVAFGLVSPLLRKQGESFSGGRARDDRRHAGGHQTGHGEAKAACRPWTSS